MTNIADCFDCVVTGPGPSDWRLQARQPPHMGGSVRSVSRQTIDALPRKGKGYSRGLTSRDAVPAKGYELPYLEAVPVGKSLAGGVIYGGDIEPRYDFAVEAVVHYVTPFCMGEILNAQSSSADLDMGTVFDNTPESVKEDAEKAVMDILMVSSLTDAYLDQIMEAGTRKAVDLAQAARKSRGTEARDAHRQIAASIGQIRAIEGSNRAFWSAQGASVQERNAARIAANGAKLQASATRDGGFWDQPTKAKVSRATSSAQPVTPASIEAANRKFWGR